MNRLIANQVLAADGASYAAFVGSHLTFSKHALRILKAEHPDLEFLRVVDLDDLDEITARNGPPILTILEESIFSQLLDDPTHLARLLTIGNLTIAYRDPTVARNLITTAKVVEPDHEIGALPLNAEIEVWLSVFNLLLCGEVLYPLAITHLGSSPVAGVDCTSDPGLTPREWEVLQMVAQGQQNKMIATALNLSEHTVKLHVHHVLKKLGVTNRTGAANWLANHGTQS